jgi:hypothetical protein
MIAIPRMVSGELDFTPSSGLSGQPGHPASAEALQGVREPKDAIAGRVVTVMTLELEHLPQAQELPGCGPKTQLKRASRLVTGDQGIEYDA